jgi:hypothetical protein
VALTCLLLFGCAQRHGLAEAQAIQPKPYVRVSTADTNVLELQIAVRSFVPKQGQGPAVWLTGVSHLGEKTYYETLQEHLSKRTLVLFEGIKGGGANVPQEKSGLSGLQGELAESLGLVFQMEAIEYERPNFRNSDLSIVKIRELLASSGETAAKARAEKDFETLLETMRGESDLSSAISYVLKLVGGHEGLQGLGRLALIELLGAIGGDLANLSGLPESMRQLEQVLVEGRNNAVIEDLAATLPKLSKEDSVALFYGAAHMSDLERRLRHGLGYRPSREAWHTAFSVDIARSGITAAQREFIRGFVRSQLQED